MNTMSAQPTDDNSKANCLICYCLGRQRERERERERDVPPQNKARLGAGFLKSSTGQEITVVQVDGLLQFTRTGYATTDDDRFLLLTNSAELGSV